MTEATARTRWAVGAAFVGAVAMIAQQLAGKAVRDAYFLSVFDAEDLPKVMTLGSMLSVVSVIGVTRLYRHSSPARLVPAFFLVNAALFVVEWLLSADAPSASAAILYLHTTGVGAVVISGFWSVLSERFDPYTAKRVIGWIAGGATLGGVLGGLAAWQGAGVLSVETMLLALAGVNVFCGAMLIVVGSPTERASAPLAAPSGPMWEVFEETPYLVRLAFLVGILALGTAGIDYLFKASAAAAYSKQDDLVSFFAQFYLFLGIATFVLQNVIGNRVVRRAGLKTAVAALPTTIVALGGVALFYPGVGPLSLLRGGAAAAESSLYRSGYELMYSPLPPRKKRSAKTVIDVGADKVGAALGGALAVFVVGLVPGSANRVLLVISLASALVCLWLTKRLAAGYVSELAESLAAGRVDAAEVLQDDPETRAVVQKTMVQLDHESVAAARFRSRTASYRRLPPRPNLSAPEWPVDDPSGDLRALSAILQREPKGVEWALRRANPIPALWVPALVRLLDDPRLSALVTTHLKQASPAHVGLLTDTILSRRFSLEVRRRCVELLAQVATARSSQGLLAALRTEPFEIRYRAAVALSAVTQRNPSLSIDKAVVLEACGKEVEKTQSNFYGSGVDTRGELSHAGSDAGRSIGYCVRLLSVILPHVPLFNALDALGEDDPTRRGTGLEYLENVLPDDLREKMLPFFLNRAVAQYARREDQVILEDIATDDDEDALEQPLIRARARLESTA